MTEAGAQSAGQIWTSATTGGCLVVVSPTGGVPPPPAGWWQVRARCDGPPRLLGPITDTQREIDRLLGSRTPIVELAADRMRSGLRRRLLGEDAEDSHADGDRVAQLNRLAELVDGPAAIVLEAAGQSDAGTLAFLTRVISRPGWLRPALILGFRQVPTSGPVAQLIAQAKSHGLVVQVVRGGPPDTPRGPNNSSLDKISPTARRVLRAAAIVGEGFEVPLVAALLHIDAMAVLHHLQEAWDAGVAIEDLGDGSFHLRAELADQLRSELLPSLASAWHRQLAEHLHQAPPTGAPSPDAAPTLGRAASHSAQAGDIDVAVNRYLSAARELSDQGASDQALSYANSALALLDHLPRTPERKHLAARALTTTGRLRWETGSGDGHTLAAAHKALSDALQLLDDSDDSNLRAELHRLRAAVSYDFGDAKHLEQALAELTEATRELTHAGEPRAAARLLNDQAAVLVAMGDPVAAAHLLDESLGTFQVLAARSQRSSSRAGRPLTADEAADRLEVAETLHLMARLPLQVAARADLQQEALVKAMEHAQEAEKIYTELDHEREAARVWQTHGQLAHRAHEDQSARQYLTQAARAQLNLGDAIGLARSTQAMAALLGDLREHAEALRLLVDSIRLNHGKGSPRGLAWNRRSLESLVVSMSKRERQERAPMIIAVRRQLESAEAQLGQVDLPPPPPDPAPRVRKNG